MRDLLDASLFLSRNSLYFDPSTSSDETELEQDFGGRPRRETGCSMLVKSIFCCLLLVFSVLLLIFRFRVDETLFMLIGSGDGAGGSVVSVVVDACDSSIS